MEGLESFIFTEDIKREYRRNIENLIFYAYKQLVESSSRYSLESIKKEIREQGKKTSRVPLEDYLTYDFVNLYLRPNRSRFGLQYIYISTQISEVKSNIEVGKIDIKFAELSDNTYVIIECKRLKNEAAKIDYYISDGIKRFTSKQYYPSIDQRYAGMIAFLEDAKPSAFEILKNMNDNLDKRTDIKTIKLLTHDTRSPNYKFDSAHSVTGGYNIDVTHFWLDYSQLITI
ncbi:hypothetical protein C900_03968 [Fulvivirga imtechensis AK7]|uniref:Uncharacterized protein n=1 Tax=Fulvivirga imtechensis AK7 TaxID=1237149 RepID=L8JQ26_9BACT|nr:hypothetical protein [Fulvivirga imtechensis]ELR70283.1 hypothetical protein C900_03968 [Fulvivirga imtechensis AK7]